MVVAADNEVSPTIHGTGQHPAVTRVMANGR
jgi:hypothetical protein